MSADWRPRLVALDIDGTLLDHDASLPTAVAEAVSQVVLAGVPVVLATGRSWHGTEWVRTALNLPPGWAVCSNGAVVLTHPPTEVVHQVTFDPTRVLATVREHAPNAAIAVEEVGRGYRVSAPFPEGDLEGEIVVQGLDDLGRHPVTRVIIRDPQASDEDFVRLAETLGLHGVSYFIGWSAWLDIAPSGVDKAAGLTRVCAELGVAAADVLAIGDGRNDIEMLQWAGRGVAVGDAPPEVQVVADHVTGRFADGGTIAELARWF